MRRTSTGRAFTLIELLVVVAIIGLLISILLPALRSARSRAREVRCRAQLSNFGLGFQYYLAESRDVFPPHKQAENQPPFWYHLIESYWNRDALRAGAASAESGDGTRMVTRCPDLQGNREDEGLDWEWNYRSGNLGYGYNAFWLGCYPNDFALWAYGGVKPTLWTRLTQVVSPAGCILAGDSQPKPDASWSASLWWPWIAEYGEGISTRHGESGGRVASQYGEFTTMYPDGRGNVLFVDGHVDGRISQEVNDVAEARPMWDPQRRAGGW